MRRVVILGCSGAGKSTFARALAGRLGHPLVHLDALFWRPGWVEPDNEAFRAAVSAAIAGDAWVTDGNYVSRTFDLRLPRADTVHVSRTFDLRLPRADTVIFLDQPRWLCVFRITWRWLTAFGRTWRKAARRTSPGTSSSGPGPSSVRASRAFWRLRPAIRRRSPS